MELKDLREKRDEALDAMDALMVPEKDKDGNDTEQRSCPDEKREDWNKLKLEVEKYNKQIKQREEEEEIQKQITARKMREKNALNVHTKDHKFSISKAFRNLEKLDGLEKETSDENAHQRGISSTGLVLSYRQVNELFGVHQRAATSVGASDVANFTETMIDDQLSIIDYQTVTQKLGVSYRRGLTGKFWLTKSAAQTATFYAEGAAIADAGQAPTKVELSPRRVGWSDTFSKESLALAKEVLIRQIISDGVIAIDKAIEKDYLDALVAAVTPKTGYATADGPQALDRADLVTLESGLKDPTNVKYVTSSIIYNAMRSVNVDTGSGLKLVKGNVAEGVTDTGIDIFRSGFFTAATDVLLGNFSEVFIGDWGAVEILQNPYIKQKEGEVEITVNQLVDTAVRNTDAFVYAQNIVM